MATIRAALVHGFLARRGRHRHLRADRHRRRRIRRSRCLRRIARVSDIPATRVLAAVVREHSSAAVAFVVGQRVDGHVFLRLRPASRRAGGAGARPQQLPRPHVGGHPVPGAPADTVHRDRRGVPAVLSPDQRRPGHQLRPDLQRPRPGPRFRRDALRHRRGRRAAAALQPGLGGGGVEPRCQSMAHVPSRHHPHHHAGALRWRALRLPDIVRGCDDLVVPGRQGHDSVSGAGAVFA